jgi:hypothetical protein
MFMFCFHVKHMSCGDILRKSLFKKIFGARADALDARQATSARDGPSTTQKVYARKSRVFRQKSRVSFTNSSVLSGFAQFLFNSGSKFSKKAHSRAAEAMPKTNHNAGATPERPIVKLQAENAH